MQPQIRSLSGLTDSADALATSQTVASATYVVLASTTLGAAQPVTVTSAGDDSGITFTIVGKDANKNAVSEVLTGANTSTATTTEYFLEVDSILTSGATDDVITVGALSANGAVSSIIGANWLSPSPFNAGMGVAVSGTVNYTVQHSFNDPEDLSAYPLTWYSTSGLTGLTSNNEGNIAFPVRAVRLKLTSSSGGAATLTYIQAGN